jgi:hypothetical protein
MATNPNAQHFTLGINSLSDWSPAELKARLIPPSMFKPSPDTPVVPPPDDLNASDYSVPEPSNTTAPQRHRKLGYDYYGTTDYRTTTNKFGRIAVTAVKVRQSGRPISDLRLLDMEPCDKQ